MDAHAHHRRGQAVPSEHAAPPPSKPKQAVLELRAKCTCGCSQDADRPGSTTSSRVGFALLSAPTERLLELPPPFDAWSIERAPASRADTFDHVPILS
jgi:hypothetical protein